MPPVRISIDENSDSHRLNVSEPAELEELMAPYRELEEPAVEPYKELAVLMIPYTELMICIATIPRGNQKVPITICQRDNSILFRSDASFER